MRAISLGYHDIADGAARSISAAVYTVEQENFKTHLDAISTQHAEVKTICQRTQWARDMPVYLTFDDGGEGSYISAAPMLEYRLWRGHFFVTTNWIDTSGYMSGTQIRELHRRGHVIGSHSCSHPERMSSLSTNQLLAEWKESCASLSDLIGERIRTASVAGGYYSRKVASAAAQAGIEVLFTSEPTTATSAVDGCLVLGRYSIQRHTRPEVAAAIAAGQPWPRWRQTALWNAKKVVKTVAGESYVTLRRRFFSSRLSEEHTVGE